jgi:hypothetical protein
VTQWLCNSTHLSKLTRLHTLDQWILSYISWHPEASCVEATDKSITQGKSIDCDHQETPLISGEVRFQSHFAREF